MTTYTTPAELDALPIGAKVADPLSDLDGDIALWHKFEDGTWHLIEADDSSLDPGQDWSRNSPASAADVLDVGPVESRE